VDIKVASPANCSIGLGYAVTFFATTRKKVASPPKPLSKQNVRRCELLKIMYVYQYKYTILRMGDM